MLQYNKNISKSMKIAMILALVGLQLSFCDVQWIEEKTSDIKKSLIMNQKLVIDYDRDVYKYAFFFESSRNQNGAAGSCQEHQRTIRSSEDYVEGFKFSNMQLDASDQLKVFQMVGSTFISVSKQGKLSFFTISKDKKQLQFEETKDLKFTEPIDYQPIIVVKDTKQAFIILEYMLVLVDVEKRTISGSTQVNFDGMGKSAIYLYDTLYVPLKTKGLLQMKVSVNVSNNIVIQKSQLITKIAPKYDDKRVNIRDIYYSSSLEKFFILDYNQGIFVTDDILSTAFLHIHEISRGYAFSFYENSNQQITIVVLEEGTSTPRGREIYLDVSGKEYKYQIDETIRLLEAPWSKIIMFDHFCLFQGKSTHALSYHSTIQNQENFYLNRIPDFLTREAANSIIVLSNKLEPYNQKDNDFVVFSFFNDGYSVSSINVHAPFLICQPLLQEQKGLSTYKVTLYSNRCLSKQTSDIWTQCQITHEIGVDVEHILVDDTNGYIIAAIVISAVFGVLIIIFIIYNGIRKYRAKILGLEREYAQLSQADKKKQNEKYQEMQEEQC